MKKRLCLKVAVALFFAICAGYILYQSLIFFHWAATTEVKMVGKTHIDFFVENGQIVDYNDFLEPTEETSKLELISMDIRVHIADYMRENNLKLKEGHHYFNRVNGTYDEYINDNFKFEKIE